LLLALIAVASGPKTASATVVNNYYSYGKELSAGNYTGVSQFRVDSLVSNLANQNCSQPYKGEPVFQTQWATDGTISNFVELGTGHQCYNGGPGGSSTFRYHFWQYFVFGTWFPLGTEPASAGSSYTFAIARESTPFGTGYIWTIGGVIKASVLAGNAYSDVIVGLESHRQEAVVPVYVGSSLKYRFNGSASWSNWAGQDYSWWFPTLTLCGGFVSATSWKAGQNTSC
jgi:hypothetical protein